MIKSIPFVPTPLLNTNSAFVQKAYGCLTVDGDIFIFAENGSIIHTSEIPNKNLLEFDWEPFIEYVDGMDWGHSCNVARLTDFPLAVQHRIHQIENNVNSQLEDSNIVLCFVDGETGVYGEPVKETIAFAKREAMAEIGFHLGYKIK